MEEIWKDIPIQTQMGQKYQVSNLGNVRVCREIIPGYFHYKAVSIFASRYRNVCLCGRIYKVARLVAQAFIGPQPKGIYVNHIDGVKHNDNITNLEYVTPSENIKHALRIGLRKRYYPMKS